METSEAEVIDFPAVEHVTVAQLREQSPDIAEWIPDDAGDVIEWQIERFAGTKYPLAEVIWRKPRGAAALIVAELDHDQTDLQADYFGHRTSRVVAIGWRKSKREDFRALRRAAATFEPTANMAPGCDEYTPRVVLVDDVYDNGSHYYKGQWSHWHWDMQRDASGSLHTFTTREQAEAFVAAQGEPHAINFGETLVHFAWQIGKESIEHRENYSMGGGNYLKAGSRHTSGWKVVSLSLDYLRAEGDIEIGGDIARTWSAN